MAARERRHLHLKCKHVDPRLRIPSSICVGHAEEPRRPRVGHDLPNSSILDGDVRQRPTRAPSSSHRQLLRDPRPRPYQRARGRLAQRSCTDRRDHRRNRCLDAHHARRANSRRTGRAGRCSASSGVGEQRRVRIATPSSNSRLELKWRGASVIAGDYDFSLVIRSSRHDRVDAHTRHRRAPSCAGFAMRRLPFCTLGFLFLRPMSGTTCAVHLMSATSPPRSAVQRVRPTWPLMA